MYVRCLSAYPHPPGIILFAKVCNGKVCSNMSWKSTLTGEPVGCLCLAAIFVHDFLLICHACRLLVVDCECLIVVLKFLFVVSFLLLLLMLLAVMIGVRNI